jgi:hypothetical protein
VIALKPSSPAAGTRFAPYAREVMGAIAAGKQPNVRLYACRPDPWTLARRHREVFGPGTAIVFPVDASPELIRWPTLRNLVGDITGLPGGTLHALARALVRDGLVLGYLLDRDHPERNLRVVRKRSAP